jgi:hypothetical protein
MSKPFFKTVITLKKWNETSYEIEFSINSISSDKIEKK